jgi:hypothetical protein
MPGGISWRPTAEFDLGLLSFDSGPKVTADVETVLWSAGQNTYRVMRYGVNSDVSPLPLVLPDGLAAKFESESLQLSYARNMGGWAWGLSLFPYNQTETTITMGADVLAKLRAKSDFAGRIGATWFARPDLTLGGYWHYESDRATATNYGATYPGGSVAESADYIGSYLTLGASWIPAPGTSVFLNCQNGRMSGRDMDASTSLLFGGVTQYLSPRVSLTAYDLDGAWGLSANYFGDDWNVGASYSPNAFQSSKEVMGTADMLYLWAAKSW